MFSTGSAAFASRSSEKYIRVAKPILIPRAASHRFTRGAMGLCPCRPTTEPGLTVSKVKSQVSKWVPVRPQPRNVWSSALPSCRSAGWLYRPVAFACQSSTRMSRMGAPVPSKIRPSIRIRSPLVSGVTSTFEKFFSKMSKPAWWGSVQYGRKDQPFATGFPSGTAERGAWHSPMNNLIQVPEEDAVATKRQRTCRPSCPEACSRRAFGAARAGRCRTGRRGNRGELLR